jgi:hypothetical protein
MAGENHTQSEKSKTTRETRETWVILSKLSGSCMAFLMSMSFRCHSKMKYLSLVKLGQLLTIFIFHGLKFLTQNTKQKSNYQASWPMGKMKVTLMVYEFEQIE